MRQNTDRREYNVCACSQKTAHGGYSMRCRRRRRKRTLGGFWMSAKVARRLLDVGKGRLSAPGCLLRGQTKRILYKIRLMKLYI